MAPLQCAPVSDIYGNNFGLSAEQIAQQTIKNNQKCAEENSNYQKNLKETEIAGESNFQDNFPKSTFGNLNGNDTNIPPRKTNLPPNSAPLSINDSKFARRPAFSNIFNNYPSNQGNSMFNRFQDMFGTRENFGSPSTVADSEYLHQLVSIAYNIELILKIIMFVIILLLIIKLLEKKNA